MMLDEYIADMGRRLELAQKVGSSPDYLWQVATGWKGRKAGPLLANRIHDATDGEVSKHDLRPDIFGPAPSEVRDAA